MLCWAAGGTAQPTGDLRGAAKRRFEEGSSAYDAKRYAEALAAFREAYALAPYPQLLFNIARCLEELGQLAEAIDAYDRYQAVHPDADLRARVDRLREKLAATPIPAPAPVVVTPAPPPVVLMAPAPARVPAHKRWWVWTITGVAVAGVALGVGLGLGLQGGAGLTFPAVTAQ